MVFDPQGFLLADAVNTSQDVYEVQFPSWGVRTVAAGQAAVNPNFQWPPPGQSAILPSLAGIAIGPRSTVDRAWVSWYRQKASGAGANTFSSVGTTPIPTSRVRPLSRKSPLMFAQTTATGILPSTNPNIPAGPTGYNPNNSPGYAMQQGLLYVFPREPINASTGTENPQGQAGANLINIGAQATTIPPTLYIDQNGNSRSFGVIPVGSSGMYWQPYLELYLYLRPPLFAPPQDRFPLLISDTDVVDTPSTNVPIEFIPIFGRKSVTIGLAGNGAVFQVGVIPCIRENALAGPTAPFEIPVPGGTAITPGANTASLYLENLNADYLVIYANVSMAPTTVQVQVAAYD